MAIGSDRVQPAKYESSSDGGDDSDAGIHQNSVPIKPQEDAIESAGLYLQDSSNRDEDVYHARDGDDQIFRDKNNTTPLTLSQLLSNPHATSHHADGSDELNIQNLGSDGQSVDKIAVTNGTGGITMSDAPAPGFGAGLYFGESIGESSTSGSTWVDKIEITVDDDNISYDRVMFFSLIARGSSISTGIGIRLVLDKDTVNEEILCSIIVRPNVTDGSISCMQHAILEGHTDEHTYSMQYRKETGSGSAFVNNARLTTWRISAGT